MLGFFAVVHVWMIFQRQFIMRGFNFSLCGGVRHIQDIIKWSPFGKCPAVKKSCSDGFHRTKWRQEWESTWCPTVLCLIFCPARATLQYIVRVKFVGNMDKILEKWSSSTNSKEVRKNYDKFHCQGSWCIRHFKKIPVVPRSSAQNIKTTLS